MEECKGTITTGEVPCLIFLPNNDCSDKTISFYMNNTNLGTRDMGQFNPFLCNATFNYTVPLGTYVFNYSTGDTGSIILEGGMNMIYLLYFGIIVVAILLSIGFIKEDATFLIQRLLHRVIYGGILLMVIGIWLGIYGFSTVDNFMNQSIAVVAIAIGAYIFIRTNLEGILDSNI